MDFVPLFEGELRYTSLESLDYEAGGQLYGTMEGEVTGDRLTGSFQLTNVAQRRSDNANCPTLRGLLTTDDGATAYVEWNGLATLRPADDARVFVTSITFRPLRSNSRPRLPLGRWPVRECGIGRPRLCATPFDSTERGGGRPLPGATASSS